MEIIKVILTSLLSAAVLFLLANHTNFPFCNAAKRRILRCFAIHAAICEMHRILSKLSFRRKMRQISASKRSQNVVEIAIIDYCGFEQVLPVILPHPSISRYSKTLLTITISRALVLFPT